MCVLVSQFRLTGILPTVQVQHISPHQPVIHLPPPTAGGAGSSALPYATVDCNLTINACGDSAVASVVVNVPGTWNGSSCTVAPTNCNVAPWGNINHGSGVTAYQTATVPSVTKSIRFYCLKYCRRK
jgi:hypothetical protein